jgi:hypothetical protein
LPQGEWYDFWTDQKFSGRKWVEVPVPLAQIPLFVRAGSVIPMGPVNQYADEKPLEVVNVHVYPGKPGAFELYEDDGLTFAYENGAYVKTHLSFDGHSRLSSELVKGDLSLLPTGRKYVTVVHSAHQPEPAIQTDCDLGGDGTCTLHALLSHPGDPAEVKASLFLPEGWRLRAGSAVQGCKFDNILHLQWTVFPVAEALPVIHRADLEFAITQGGETQTVSRCLQWGSGWASRWQMVGHFDNTDGQGLERPTQVESNPDLAEYQAGNQTVRWNRSLLAEFNPFGYVDFKGVALPESGSQGVAYAKSRVWAGEATGAYLEITGDPNLKIWLNGMLVFTSPTIVLRRVLPEAVNLKEGWNSLLVKAALNFEKPWSGREYGFTLRFVDESGKVIESLKYSPS